MSAAVKAFSFDCPQGEAGSTLFIPLHFRCRLLLLFGNGRSESANTIGLQTLYQCYGAAVSDISRFAVPALLRHGSGANQAKNGYRTDSVFTELIDQSAAAYGGRLDISSITNEGITFIVGAQFQRAHRIFAVAIGGALEAAIMEVNEPAATGVQTYTDAPFQPQQLILFATQVTAADATINDRMCPVIGLVRTVTSTDQHILSNSALSSSSTGHTTKSALHEGECLLNFSSIGSINARAVCTEFTPDGFKLNWLSRITTGRKYPVVMLAGNYELRAGRFQIGFSTGAVHTISGFPAPPDLTLLLGAGRDAMSTLGSQPTIKRVTLGAFTGPLERWSITAGSPASGSLNVYTGTRFDNCYLNINPDGTVRGRMDVDAITADGFVLDVEEAETDGGSGQSSWVLYWSFIDIGEGEGGGGDGPCLEVDPGLQVFSPDPDWRMGVRERTAWLTDVLPSPYGGEQRVELRRHPRTHLAFRVATLDARASARLEALLYGWQGNRYAVPLWPDAVQITAPVAPGATSVAAPTVLRRFAAGGRMLLWRDIHTYELLEIETVASESLGLAEGAVGAWAADGRTFAIPVLVGRLPATQPLRRLAGFAAEATVEFELEPQPGTEPSAAEFPQYHDIDVLEAESSADVEARLHRSLFFHDSRTGALYGTDRSKLSVPERTLALPLLSRAEWQALRQFLHARRGRLLPFWLPTYHDDLVLRAPVASDAVEMQVEPSGYLALQFPKPARRHLALLLRDGSGQKAYRAVAAAEEEETHDLLTLDAAPGVALPAETRVSFLTLCRLADDDPEITWHTPEAAECHLDVLELPEEAPDPDAEEEVPE